MYIVSDSFARAMKNKPYIVKLTLENQNVIQGEAIQEITFRGGTSGETEAFTLGGAVSGSVEIMLNKTLVPIVEQGQRINVDLGMELEIGTEWLPMGEYYVTEPTADDDVLTVKACDALAAKFDRSYEPMEGFDFDSDGGVDSVVFLKAICERRGVKVDVSNLESVSLRTAPDGFTERQIIGFIAALYGGFVHVDRAGVLRICTFRKTEQKVTPDDYYDGGMVKAEYTYSVQWIKCFNETTELTMIMGDTAAKQGVYLESIWMDNVILSKLWEQLQGFSYEPVAELSFLGNPMIDPGDIITMEDMSGVPHEVPVMGIDHEYDGGIITKVAAYGQADATECTGSVERQMQRVAVKAKTYSGMALDDAKKYADSLDRAMNQLEVLKRLTNATDDAIYMTEDGKLAIKATAIITGVLDAALVTVKNIVADNIISGILRSKDGKAAINLNDGMAEFFNGVRTNGLIVQSKQTDNVRLFQIYTPLSKEDIPYVDMSIRNASGKTILRMCETFNAEGKTAGALLKLSNPQGTLSMDFGTNDNDVYVSVFNESTGQGKRIFSLNADGDISILGRIAKWEYSSAVGKYILASE